MLKVYTSKISYKGENKLNVSIKSGNKIFAPSWEIVMSYKNGKITEEQYTLAYHNMMEISYKRNRTDWEDLLSKEEVVLCCYCSAGTFCHRLLLAKILVKLGAKYQGEI
jgi:uncharacterized protein YeaO (DUF488 family)